MSFLSSTLPNRFTLWWQNTFSNVENVLPLLQQNPNALHRPELRSYQDMVHDASMTLQREACPRFAADMNAQLIAVFCTLQMGLDAREAGHLTEAESYFHLARVKWVVLQAGLEKRGVHVS